MRYEKKNENSGGSEVSKGGGVCFSSDSMVLTRLMSADFHGAVMTGGGWGESK